MTRRERLETKLERREEWANKARARSADRIHAAEAIADGIPMGQPILVGHHSERRARRDRERIDGHMSAGVEAMHLAAHHAEKASGLARQLDRSIFSDDDDAIEALEARLRELEAKRDTMKKANADAVKLPLCNYRAPGIVAFNRFHGTNDLRLRQIEMGKAEYSNLHKDRRATYVVEGSHRVRAALIAGGEMVCIFLADAKATEPPTPSTAGTKPYEDYQLTNLGAEIRRNRQRLEEVKAQQARRAEAEEAPGGVTVSPWGEDPTYCRVTFAEKPDGGVLEALRGAGFRWSAGSWRGRADQIPASIIAP